MYTEYKYLTAMVVFGPLGWLKADNWSAVSRKGNEGQCLGGDLSQGQGEVWRELWRQISSVLLTTSILSMKFYLFKREMCSYHFFIFAWLNFEVSWHKNPVLQEQPKF